MDFLNGVKAAVPFQITHILTDRGSCFTAESFEEACQAIHVDRRRTRAYSPQTNGIVERFNGRIASEVLPINVANHGDLEALLRGFNHAFNRRRQRVLGDLSPTKRMLRRLGKKSSMANLHFCQKFESNIMIRANDVSQPDS